MRPLDLVKLTRLMELTKGRPEIMVGLIDGPVNTAHPALAADNVREIPGKLRGTCALASSAACVHGTFVAGILSAKRNTVAPAICPDCTLLLRPIFTEMTSAIGHVPRTTPEELAAAVIDCAEAGARVINLSVAFTQPSSAGQRELKASLDYAARRGIIVVAAAGNQGTVGSTVITRHPSVIPVVAYDLRGRPMSQSNLGSSIGRQGLGAPGDAITSLGATGTLHTFSGTSAATPFVTGAIALLWSSFPTTAAAAVRYAITYSHTQRRTAVVPPLIDAWTAYQVMAKAHPGRWKL